MPDKPLRLQLKFWGVRGSTPTPVAGNLRHGGNTSCFEITNGTGDRIIIDAGTGIRSLGLQLVKENPPPHLDVFLTHFHWDHIQGLPFFAPLLTAGSSISFHSFPTAEEIHARLARQMSAPYFTLDFHAVAARCEYLSNDKTVRCGGITITPFPLNHPQGASGYRVESNDASIVIATDVEHGDCSLDKLLRENAEGADVLVYDAQYTPEEYISRRGWGHSSYTAAASVAGDAKVRQLALFHHDPNHDDDAMDEIVRQTLPLFENTIAASELNTVTI